MNGKNRKFIVLLGIIAILFLAGLLRLFELGFEEGGNLPHYSSYRSDPLGTRALYSALESLPGISVSRNLEPITKLGKGRDTTIIFAGANISKDPEEFIEKLEEFAAEGGRLVITFYPMEEKPAPLFSLDLEDEEENEEEKKEEEESSDEDTDEEEKKKKNAPPEPWLAEMVSIEERWGFTCEFFSSAEKPGEIYAEKQAGPLTLPLLLSWHSALYFNEPDDAWHVLYTRSDKGVKPLVSTGERAVIMERSWGEGTIVLSGDSYFLSNEAMLEDRHSQLLAWLIGPSSKVIFDETHLGVRIEYGIMTLMRKYRLEGVLIALVIVAALFIWRNAASLVPKTGGAGMEPARAIPPMAGRGKDSAAGLVNLLRRSIPSRKILQVCIQEWKRTYAHGPKLPGDREKRIESLAGPESALPTGRGHAEGVVEAYRTICEILAGRK